MRSVDIVNRQHLGAGRSFVDRSLHHRIKFDHGICNHFVRRFVDVDQTKAAFSPGLIKKNGNTENRLGAHVHGELCHASHVRCGIRSFKTAAEEVGKFMRFGLLGGDEGTLLKHLTSEDEHPAGAFHFRHHGLSDQFGRRERLTVLHCVIELVRLNADFVHHFVHVAGIPSAHILRIECGVNTGEFSGITLTIPAKKMSIAGRCGFVDWRGRDAAVLKRQNQCRKQNKYSQKFYERGFIHYTHIYAEIRILARPKEHMSQNKTKWDHRIDLMENQIRGGEIEAVRNALMAPDMTRVPRAHCARLANIARRAQRPSLSLRLLLPLVRPKVKNFQSASRDELLEYAYALQRVGARHESLKMFEDLSKDDFKAHLGSAFHHISEWNYTEALVHIDKVLGHAQISKYEVVVARVNRLACLVALGDREAERLFFQLGRSMENEGSLVLRANILEIMAQYWIDVGNFSEARRMLGEAKELLVDSSDINRLLIEKWLVVCEALEHGSVVRLDDFRRRALALNHWETLRDLDYVRAKVDPASRWADWVFYGTPFAAFRRRLQDVRIFSDACWVAREDRPVKKWDPWFPGGGEGDLMHRFTASLLRDFYRPACVGEIFSNLFPDQYFDINVSPNRIHQIASRARHWLEQEGVPARLEEAGGSYSLRWDSGLALLARRSPIRFTKVEFLFERFRQPLPVALTAREWAEKLACSAEKCKRLLREGSEAGLIEVQRKGQYSKYILKPRTAAA